MTFAAFAKSLDLSPDNFAYQIYKFSGELKQELMDKVKRNGDDSPELLEEWSKVFDDRIENKWIDLPRDLP
jgi:hypothetical protein